MYFLFLKQNITSGKRKGSFPDEINQRRKLKNIALCIQSEIQSFVSKLPRLISSLSAHGSLVD